MKKLLSLMLMLALLVLVTSNATAQEPVGGGEEVEDATEEVVEEVEESVGEPVEEPVSEDAGEAVEEAVEEEVEGVGETVSEPVDDNGEAVEEFEPVGDPGELSAAQLDDSQASNDYATTTAFAAQNTATSAASVQISIYNTSGSEVFNDSQTVNAGYAYLLDQATQSLTNNFQGSAVLSADQEMAVTTIMKGLSGTATPRYDTYNGVSAAKVGTNLTVAQFVRGLASLGDTFNSLLAIQNTTANAASVTVNFNAVTAGTSSTQNYNIPANGTQYIQATDLTALGSPFFGFVTITSDQPVAAINTVQSGDEGSTKGSLLTMEGSAQTLSSASGEVFGGQMYKGIVSAGCTFASAVNVVNVGTTEATVTVKYYPAALGSQFAGGDSFSYNTTIAAGGFKGIDQRFDTNITTATFYGSVSLQVTAGEVVATSNVRAAECESIQTNSVPFEATSGTKAFAPMAFKNNNQSISNDYSWSTAVGITNLGGTAADVTVTYYPYGGGSSVATTVNVPANGSRSVDQRFVDTLSDNFAGSIVIESTSNSIRGAVNIRGNDGSAGDTLTGYNLITQ